MTRTRPARAAKEQGLRRSAKARHNQKGAALVEYGLLVGLICLVSIASVAGTGVKVSEIFEDITYELRIAQLIATAEIVHYVPNTPRDDIFPAQACFQGVPGTGTQAQADVADCFVNVAGGNFATGPDRDILMFLAGGGETVSMGNGDNWMVKSEGFAGKSTVSVGEGYALLDLRPLTIGEVIFAPTNSVDLDISLPDGTIEINDHFPAQSVARFIFADGEMNRGEVFARLITDQIEAGEETIEGSYLGDRMPLAPDSNGVYVLPLEGNDEIIYSGGTITVSGDGNFGEDVLDMRPLSQAQVSYSRDWGGTALRIGTPSGFVRLTDLDDNIERVIFSDGEASKADLQARMN